VATRNFAKLFGKNGANVPAPETGEGNGDYEYYHRRRNTYYFRNGGDDKFSIDYKEPQAELVRGGRYHVDALNSRNS
jgi:hypothetical protein